MYCTNRNRQHKADITAVKEEINRCEDFGNVNKVIALETQLTILRHRNLTGTKIRSREQGILNEEKPTTYLFMQETIRQSRKNIQKLVYDTADHKVELEAPVKIRRYLVETYQAIYSGMEADYDAHSSLLAHVASSLDDADRALLDTAFTAKELGYL